MDDSVQTISFYKMYGHLDHNSHKVKGAHVKLCDVKVKFAARVRLRSCEVR